MKAKAFLVILTPTGVMLVKDKRTKEIKGKKIYWKLPGGGTKYEDASSVDTVIREVNEETNLRIKASDIKIVSISQNKNFKAYTYLTSVSCEPVFTIKNNEIAEVEVWNTDDILGYKGQEEILFIVRKILKTLIESGVIPNFHPTSLGNENIILS